MDEIVNAQNKKSCSLNDLKLTTELPQKSSNLKHASVENIRTIKINENQQVEMEIELPSGEEFSPNLNSPKIRKRRTANFMVNKIHVTGNSIIMEEKIQPPKTLEEKHQQLNNLFGIKPFSAPITKSKV